MSLLFEKYFYNLKRVLYRGCILKKATQKLQLPKNHKGTTILQRPKKS
jgi:hypothetical protein